jgi:N-dimethylarginine dimethylaminohydrolase
MIICLGSSCIYNKSKCNNYPFFKNLSIIINRLKKELEILEIKVIQPTNFNKKICLSLWVRDIFINIDNTIYLLEKSTTNIRHPIEELKTTNIKGIKINDIFVDGGDIIQDNSTIFIGISSRTPLKSYYWFKKNFPNKNIIKIKHHALHLDCCFCVLPNNTIIYSKKYIKSFPSYLRKIYNIKYIEEFITKDVDSNLATNLLLIGNNIITADFKQFYNFYNYLRLLKFNVILIPFYDVWKDGGGVRCMTQWINSGNNTIQ